MKQKAVGSNQFQDKYKSRVFGHFDKVLAVLLFAYLMFLAFNFTKSYATGMATDHWLNSLEYGTQPEVNIYFDLAPKKGLKEQTMNIDLLVNEYATKYGKTLSDKHRIKVLVHFLLYREAGYGTNPNCGDSGKACGPLQYWEGTWNRMRGQMKRQGYIHEIGSRMDMEQSIETTAWAIANGHENEWGPISRNEIKI
jgi:hypothetical protein